MLTSRANGGWRVTSTPWRRTRPRGRQLEPRDHPEGRRLARARRPEHREELAVADVEIDVVDGDQPDARRRSRRRSAATRRPRRRRVEKTFVRPSSRIAGTRSARAGGGRWRDGGGGGRWRERQAVPRSGPRIGDRGDAADGVAGRSDAALCGSARARVKTRSDVVAHVRERARGRVETASPRSDGRPLDSPPMRAGPTSPRRPPPRSPPPSWAPPGCGVCRPAAADAADRPGSSAAPREVNIVAEGLGRSCPIRSTSCPGETVLLHVVNGGLEIHEAGDRRRGRPGRVGGRRGARPPTRRPARPRRERPSRTSRGSGSSSRRVSAWTWPGPFRADPAAVDGLLARLPHPGPLGEGHARRCIRVAAPADASSRP